MIRKKPVKGKTEKSLEYSRKFRAELLFKLGIKKVPTSILVHDRSDRAYDEMVNKRSYSSTSFKHKCEDARIREAFNASGMQCRSGALSRFPQNIGRLLVKFYCPEYGVVYDPFAGHNSRMQLTFESNRSYVGVDISHEFMVANRKIRRKLIESKKGTIDGSKCFIKLIEGDSSVVYAVNGNYADFTITSPPYWDLEDYGNEEQQLGNAKFYSIFLRRLWEHIYDNHRILKPGTYCAWFINDFTKDSVFYPYHCDVIDLFKDVGFEIFAIYIVDLGNSIASAFVRKPLLSARKFAKQHEYCVIGRKVGKSENIEEHFRKLENGQ